MSSEAKAKSEITWHKIKVSDTLSILKSNKNGLNSIEIMKRLEEHSQNIIESTNTSSIIKLLYDQVNNFLIILLLFAVIISASIGHLLDAFAILIIVLFSIALGFIQEYRTGWNCNGNCWY